MGEVIPFHRPRLPRRGEGLTLCHSGHHKWRILQAQKFDVKQGRLVTVLQCVRCKKIKNEAR